LVGRFKARDHLEDQGVDGRLIFKMNLKEKRWEAVDWIDLAQDRDRWRAVVKTVMSIRVAYNLGNLFTGRGNVRFSRRTAPWI
jgi:hypothetical protein